MSYTKATVTIDLDEYNDLLKANKGRRFAAINKLEVNFKEVGDTGLDVWVEMRGKYAGTMHVGTLKCTTIENRKSLLYNWEVSFNRKIK